MAQKWAQQLHNPGCFRAGDKMPMGRHVSLLSLQPLLSGGSPMLQTACQNQKWPASGPSGYTTHAVCGSAML